MVAVGVQRSFVVAHFEVELADGVRGVEGPMQRSSSLLCNPLK